MAAPSEGFTWKLFGHPRQQCWECKREPLKIADVGEHRRLYPGGVDQFRCKDCQQRQVQAMIEENRRALGLHHEARS